MFKFNDLTILLIVIFILIIVYIIMKRIHWKKRRELRKKFKKHQR